MNKALDRSQILNDLAQWNATYTDHDQLNVTDALLLALLAEVRQVNERAAQAAARKSNDGTGRRVGW